MQFKSVILWSDIKLKIKKEDYITLLTTSFSKLCCLQHWTVTQSAILVCE